MQNFSLNLLTSALIVSLVSMGAQAVEVRESTNYPEDAQVDEIVVNGNDVVITADKNFTLGKGSILDAAQVKSPNSLTLNVQNGTLTLNAQGNAISLNDKAINTTIKISANQVIYNNPNEDPKRAHYAIYLTGKKFKHYYRG